MVPNGRLQLPVIRAALVSSLALLAPSLRADDASRPPSFLQNKPLNFDTDNKKEGYYFTGLPEIGFDPSNGWELGALVDFFQNGPRSSPFFLYTPFRHHLQAQVNFSTLGYQQHYLDYDAPYVLGSPMRVRAELMFERNTSANYFGAGEAGLAPLSFQGRSYGTVAAQTAAASALHPDGKTASPRYNHYRYNKPSGWVGLERDFGGGRFRVQYGVIVQRWWVDTYDGQAIQGVDPQGRSVPAIEGATKLGQDCQRGVLTGCGGGWNNLLKAGFAYDTRDFEKNPRSGVFADATGEWSSGALGSSFDYVRLTMIGRFYASPLKRFAPALRAPGAGFTFSDLVVAGRLLYSMLSGAVPFFAMDTLASTKGDDMGLGGERTLRGYLQDRFIGHDAVVANAELRWNFVHFPILGEEFALQLAPFFDTGRVFDKPSLALTSWKPSAGAGLRVAWNQSTLVMFDFAGSQEDGLNVYIDIDLMY